MDPAAPTVRVSFPVTRVHHCFHRSCPTGVLDSWAGRSHALRLERPAAWHVGQVRGGTGRLGPAAGGCGG